ncbi:hypothetical protein ACLOJK_025895 [Asimina triloba]
MGEALSADAAKDGKMGSLSTFGSALFPSIAAIWPSEVEMGQPLCMGYGRSEGGWTPPDNAAAAGSMVEMTPMKKMLGTNLLPPMPGSVPLGLAIKIVGRRCFRWDLQWTLIDDESAI